MKINILHRKDRLIITTIDLIDELGIQSLSTKEIAKREGVSEATLFRHYKSKNELLLSVLNYFSKFDEDIFYSAKLKDLSPTNSIYYLIDMAVGYYENYPAITSIMQLMDVFRYEPEFEETIKNIFTRRIEMIKKLIENAKLEGEIKQNLDSEYLAVLISGLVREICLKWRFEDRSFSLKEKVFLELNMLLDALSK